MERHDVSHSRDDQVVTALKADLTANSQTIYDRCSPVSRRTRGSPIGPCSTERRRAASTAPPQGSSDPRGCSFFNRAPTTPRRWSASCAQQSQGSPAVLSASSGEAKLSAQ
eukprot:5648670-Pyramimonas_sp.AAC.1